MAVLVLRNGKGSGAHGYLVQLVAAGGLLHLFTRPPSPFFYHNGNLLTFGQPPLSMDNICEHLAPDDPEPFVHLGLWSLGPLRFSISDAI